MTRRRVLMVVVALPLLVVVASLLYLRFADLSGYRGWVEEVLTVSLGREVSIAGTFRPRISRFPSLVAEKITLANPEGNPEPFMVQVDHLAVTVDLWSLISGPLRVCRLEIQGARVLLEVDGSGAPNWELELAAGEEVEASEPLEIVVEQLEIIEFELTYRDASREKPIELTVERFDAQLGDAGKLEIEMIGQLNGVDLGLGGRVGPLDHLLRGTAIDQEITGHLGDAELSLAGSVKELATLGGSDLAISARGPSITAITSIFGLPSPGQGSFHLEGRISPSPSGTQVAPDGGQGIPGFSRTEVALDAELGDLAAEVKGSMKGLLDPSELDLDVELSGSDLQAAGGLFGIQDLPSDPFLISGRLERDASRVSVEGLELHVGENRLTADGVLGNPPLMLGSDFAFRAEGPDLAVFAPIAGVALPEGRFQGRGRLVRKEVGVALEGVEIEVAETTLKADGLLGDPPGFQQTDLELHGRGPALRVFQSLVSVDLPPGRFSIDGRLSYDGAGMALEKVTARLGDNLLSVKGTLVASPGLVGTDLHVNVAGPDLGQIGDLAGRAGLPGEPFEIDGRIAVRQDGYELSSLEASLGDVWLELDGMAGLPPGFAGTDLRVSIAGQDVGWIATLGGLDGLPPDPFRIRGRLRMAGAGFGEGYLLDGVEAVIGKVSVKLHGRVGPLPDPQGTDLEVESRGESLLALAPYLKMPALPDEPFTVSGRVQVGPYGYGLEQVTAELGANRLGIDGVLGPLPALPGTDLVLRISGDRLADVERYVATAGLGEWPPLPEETYTVSGQVLVGEASYDLRAISAELGETQLKVHGTLGLLPDLHGTDLALDARGPDASFIGALAGVSLPAEPFLVRGGAGWDAGRVRFSGLHIELGGVQGDLNGTLGGWPRFVGTELDFHANGDSLAPLAGLVNRPSLPDETFRISGRFSGNPERFTLEEFDARLGESDMRGSFRLGLEGKPDLHGEFHSARLDLTALGKKVRSKSPVEAGAPSGAKSQTEPEAEDEAAEAPETDPATKAESGAERSADAGAQAEPTTGVDAFLDEDAEQGPAPARREKRRVIPGEPLDLKILRAADVDISWKIDELLGKASSLSDFEIGVHLQDGRLEIDPFSGSGSRGGDARGELALEPRAEDYRVAVHLKAKDIRLDLLTPLEDKEGGPRVDLELALDGVGSSWHELASGANGYINFVMGEGRLDSSALNILTADVLMEILDVLNPFRKKDPYTHYECAVILVDLTDGLATLEPLAVRTDKMTVVGNGKIAFVTEDLDLVWVAKPRKGVGLSASAITNPHIKLGGTLGKPAVEIKPLQSVTATGAAVATAGLSILARGLWDRATAERKVCGQALKEAERRAEAREAMEAHAP